MTNPNPKPTLIGRTTGATVPVYVAAGSSGHLAGIIARHAKSPRVALVTDHIVSRLHGARMVRQLRLARLSVDPYVLPAGEKVKSARVVGSLHESWFRRGYDRSTAVVALGGGTIGDAVGFAAATFLRGIPLIQVPTTLIGQVDSSAGGKVGINHRLGKNLIGAFYQPSAIVVDPGFLATLPAREIKSGLAEVIKYGIIKDSKLFSMCESHCHDWVDKRSDVEIETLKRCLRIKLQVVNTDERDTGLRNILNFGHTLGHAFEAAGGFRLLKHGESVTLGMVAASWIAHSRSMLNDASFDRITAVCRSISPDSHLVKSSAHDLLPYLKFDKKRLQGQSAWVLPVRIGAVTIVRDVTDKEIRAAIQYATEWSRTAQG